MRSEHTRAVIAMEDRRTHWTGVNRIKSGRSSLRTRCFYSYECVELNVSIWRLMVFELRTWIQLRLYLYRLYKEWPLLLQCWLDLSYQFRVTPVVRSSCIGNNVLPVAYALDVPENIAQNWILSVLFKFNAISKHSIWFKTFNMQYMTGEMVKVITRNTQELLIKI